LSGSSYQRAGRRRHPAQCGGAHSARERRVTLASSMQNPPKRPADASNGVECTIYVDCPPKLVCSRPFGDECMLSLISRARRLRWDAVRARRCRRTCRRIGWFDPRRPIGCPGADRAACR
jgi:hypothetical protein